MKRELIFPRNSMKDVWTGQDLPAIYGKINLKMMFDFSERTGLYTRDKVSGIVATLDGGAGENSTAQMWSNGEPGGIDLDGATDICLIPSAQQSLVSDWLDRGKGSTTMAWIKDGSYTAYGCLMGYWDYDASTNQNYILIRRNNTDNKWGAAIRNGTSTQAFQVYCTNAHAGTTAPYHLAITYSGGTTYTSIGVYINGVAQAMTVTINNTLASASLWDSGVGVGIGSYRYLQSGAYSSGAFLDSTMHLLTGCGRVLTTAEIQTIYNFEKQYVR